MSMGTPMTIMSTTIITTMSISSRHPEVAAEQPSKGGGPGASASSFEARHSAVQDARKRAYGSHLRMTDTGTFARIVLNDE